MSYQGWKNYETWAVNLWLQNDESTYRHWQCSAQDAWDEAETDKHFNREERALLELEDRLKDELESDAEDAIEGGTLWYDLLHSALQEVEWREIASAFLECIDRDVEEDDE